MIVSIGYFNRQINIDDGIVSNIQYIWRKYEREDLDMCIVYSLVCFLFCKYYFDIHEYKRPIYLPYEMNYLWLYVNKLNIYLILCYQITGIKKYRISFDFIAGQKYAKESVFNMLCLYQIVLQESYIDRLLPQKINIRIKLLAIYPLSINIDHTMRQVIESFSKQYNIEKESIIAYYNKNIIYS